jgi:hypothetical protein
MYVYIHIFSFIEIRECTRFETDWWLTFVRLFCLYFYHDKLYMFNNPISDSNQEIKLYWTSSYSMKTYEAVLNCALDGGEWSISSHGLFTSGVRAPATHWIGGLVGLCRSGRGGEGKNSPSFPPLGIGPRSPSP